ncbi:hypothetical protein [Halogeometricum sp. CBA1124]|uniref:hypothetical protein n=1 Tax=Halogeometricum sp. CBA1124 TaxID=2668071 RepID=UPI001E3AA16A|nr:hypothetical protein [Halogeometricum sp. CBA1124]
MAISRECDEDARTAAEEALDLLGLLRPVEFEVWVDDVVAFASADRDRLAFVGLRALAQLSAVRPGVAKAGLDAAMRRLETPHAPTRRAALAVVGEVGEAFPDAVAQADRQVMAAMRDDDPSVRLAGTMTAGKLLGAEPQQFPRTVTTLPDASKTTTRRCGSTRTSPSSTSSANTPRRCPRSVTSSNGWRTSPTRNWASARGRPRTR